MFPLVLLPIFEPLGIGFGVALVNALVALGIAKFALMRRRAPIALSMGLAGLLIAAIVTFPTIHQYFLKRYFYYVELSDSFATLFGPDNTQPDVFHASSPYQKINIVLDDAPRPHHALLLALSRKLTLPENRDFPAEQILTLDGRFQFNSSTEEIYHEYFAHVPIISTGVVPTNVLVLGGGDGLLIRELLKHPEIMIRHVDLDSTLLELAKTHPTLRRLNTDALLDPRVTTTRGDGYYFIRNTPDTFDAIYIDFPKPNDYNLARLYSREFFYAVREHLNQGGFAVFDSVGTARLSVPEKNGRQKMRSNNLWPVYYNTLRAAGFANWQIRPFLTTLTLDRAQLDGYLEGDDVRSRLAVENAEAMARAVSERHRRELLDLMVEENKEKKLRQAIESYQQGFIMLTVPGTRREQEYTQYEIDLFVLNEERYAKAFAFDYPYEAEIRPELVNSILRPKFPTGSIWRPKLPY
jgi:spermidine synthase